MTYYTMIYFRADNEAAFVASWPTLAANALPRNWDADHVGSVTTTPGTYDEDGNEVTPPVVDGRYHVNLLVRDTDPECPNAAAYGGGAHVLGAAEVEGDTLFGSPPTVPVRRFAGM